MPLDLLNCIAQFIHQLEINDYVTTDGLHDLKMNAYWPAIHGFYIAMVQNNFDFNDPEIIKEVLQANKERADLLPPTFTPLNDQDRAFKAWIDAQSYQGLLQRWRNSGSGDPIFIGPIGQYYKEMLSYKRKLTPDNGVRASKNIGWDGA